MPQQILNCDKVKPNEITFFVKVHLSPSCLVSAFRIKAPGEEDRQPSSELLLLVIITSISLHFCSDLNGEKLS